MEYDIKLSLKYSILYQHSASIYQFILWFFLQPFLRSSFADYIFKTVINAILLSGYKYIVFTVKIVPLSNLQVAVDPCAVKVNDQVLIISTGGALCFILLYPAVWRYVAGQNHNAYILNSAFGTHSWFDRKLTYMIIDFVVNWFHRKFNSSWSHLWDETI